MVRKYIIHKLQTNQLHREEELQNTHSYKTYSNFTPSLKVAEKKMNSCNFTPSLVAAEIKLIGVAFHQVWLKLR